MKTLNTIQNIKEVHGEKFASLLEQTSVEILNDYVWDRFGNPSEQPVPEIVTIEVSVANGQVEEFGTMFNISDQEYDRATIHSVGGMGFPDETNNFYDFDVEIEQLTEQLAASSPAPFDSFKVSFQPKILLAEFVVL